VAVLKELTHLPVILDPSHATGKRSLVPPLARACVAIGADGMIVEIHPDPAKAISDGAQSLDPAGWLRMMEDLGPYLRLWHAERARELRQTEPVRVG
jgi:3-deoxy-7-phosphoheptulonate synthase